MSRLDRHVSTVQNKLAMRQFVHALAWTTLGLAALAILGIALWRVLGETELPAWKWWLAGAAAGIVGAAAYALTRRPSSHDAAVAIDRQLKLHEKFSTALYVRPSKDPFAQAAVRDAERTADDVQLQRQFPVTFPRVGYAALTAVAAAFVVGLWLPARTRASDSSQAKKEVAQEAEVAKAKREVEKALAVAESAPKSVSEDANIKREIAGLEDILKNRKFDDPFRAQRKAEQALQDVQQSLAEEAERANRVALEQKKAFHEAFGDASDYKSEVKDVDKDLAKNDFGKAVDDVAKLAKEFDKMNEEQKEQVAKDMAKLADKLQNAANDPKVQQQIQDKLQQMGASQQQAQQMAQQMQQAAQGDKQAQQQVAQMANQMQKQLNQQMQQLQQQANQGNQQAQQQLAQLQAQQQAIQQAIKGMQAQANAQAQAQQMSQAAQQMAQAMQQQAQAGQQQQAQGSQKQSGQNGQQAQSSKQGGQQQGQGGQQQMANAQSQMQQAMQSMQAAQSDANAVAQAQQQAMKSGNGQGDDVNGQGNGQGQGQDGGMQPQPGSQNKGEFAQGDTNKQGTGSGEGGISFGGANNNKSFAAFDTKMEHDIGQEKEDGKVLASTVIKDNHPIKGESKLGLQQITESAEKQRSDEVDEDHVNGASRKAAEEYFRTMHQDAAPQAPVK